MRRAVAGLLGCAAAGVVNLAALAQPHPPTLPTRDVDVTYRTGALEQRWRFRAADQKLRLDPPTQGVYMILDYSAHRMVMVNDTERATIDAPAPARTPFGAPLGAGTVRHGTDRVAGLECTEWETGDTAGQPTLACFTADGVMLRARRGDAVLVEADRVAYGPLDDALFVVPASYHRGGRP